MRSPITKLAVLAAAAALALAGCGSSSADSGGSSSASGSAKPFKVIAFTSGNQAPVGDW